MEGYVETLVLRMTFSNENEEKGIVSIKDILETATEADITDLMDKIILTGFMIKGRKATLKDSAKIVRTIIEDVII